jgi:hypothetical protein
VLDEALDGGIDDQVSGRGALLGLPSGWLRRFPLVDLGRNLSAHWVLPAAGMSGACPHCRKKSKMIETDRPDC